MYLWNFFDDVVTVSYGKSRGSGNSDMHGADKSIHNFTDTSTVLGVGRLLSYDNVVMQKVPTGAFAPVGTSYTKIYLKYFTAASNIRISYSPGTFL